MILVPIVFISLTSNAMSVDRALLRAATRARTGPEVEIVAQLQDQTKISRIACDIELREKRVPTACYSALRNELELGTISKARHTKRLTELDSICRSNAPNEDLRLFSTVQTDLSLKCREQVAKQIELLKYRHQF
ncbi:MAG: hypothetical protein AB7F86_06345 [Bdellovibrionales bacterium]